MVDRLSLPDRSRARRRDRPAGREQRDDGEDRRDDAPPRQRRERVFKRPIRLGETIHVQGRLDRLVPAGDEAGRVGLAWDVVGNDELVRARARVDVLWRRDTPAAPPVAADATPCGEDVWGLVA